MARKNVSEMNNGELYKHYRNQRYGAAAGKWGAIIIPFVAVFGAKWNEYVEILGADNKWRLTVGALLAIFVAAIAVYKEIKHDEKTKHLSGVVGWGLAFAIVCMLEVITRDLKLIIGCEFAGQFVSKGFEYWGLYASGEAEEYKKLAREDGTLHQSKIAEKVDKVKTTVEKGKKPIKEESHQATE